MNFRENVLEGWRSIQSNLLRTILTALIIAIGITSLVGILTAVDSIQASVDDSFADLGASSFDIEAPSRRFRRSRRPQKVYPPLEYRQVMQFQDKYNFPAQVSISTRVTGVAEIKYQTEKTNPNVRVYGINQNFLSANNQNLESGRNFSKFEQASGAYVAIIGSEIKETLFKNRSPINELITLRGGKYKVVGLLEEKGSSQSGSGDRSVFVPLENGRVLTKNSTPTYEIKTVLNNNVDFDIAIGEATILMRRIRRDEPGMPDSFIIKKSETLAERLGSITAYLQLGGIVVGFITLVGASIGLMNIMLVSVTERTREIGVRKALGATPTRIRQQFLIEAIVICQIGGFFGIILGILAGNWVSQFTGAGTFVIPWFWMLVAIIVCVLVGVFSGFYPAYKASRLDPIESLRFE